MALLATNPEIPFGFARTTVRAPLLPRHAAVQRSSADAPYAVALLRKLLASQPDNSVVMIQRRVRDQPVHGTARTTPAEAAEALLDVVGDGGHVRLGTSPRCAQTASRWNVRGFARRGTTFWCTFRPCGQAHSSVAEWPSPIVFSGFEVGLAVTYPAASIEKDFGYAKNHPLAEAASDRAGILAFHSRTCSSAILSRDEQYFGLSEAGAGEGRGRWDHPIHCSGRRSASNS